jgi:hypothetical protein
LLTTTFANVLFDCAVLLMDFCRYVHRFISLSHHQRKKSLSSSLIDCYVKIVNGPKQLDYWRCGYFTAMMILRMVGLDLRKVNLNIIHFVSSCFIYSNIHKSSVHIMILTLNVLAEHVGIGLLSTI